MHEQHKDGRSDFWLIWNDRLFTEVREGKGKAMGSTLPCHEAFKSFDEGWRNFISVTGRQWEQVDCTEGLEGGETIPSATKQAITITVTNSLCHLPRLWQIEGGWRLLCNYDVYLSHLSIGARGINVFFLVAFSLCVYVCIWVRFCGGGDHTAVCRTTGNEWGQWGHSLIWTLNIQTHTQS